MGNKIKFESIVRNIIKINETKIINVDNISYSSSLYKSAEFGSGYGSGSGFGSGAGFGLGGYGIELI